MKAEDRLKQYFYEHIVKHELFIRFSELLDKQYKIECFDDVLRYYHEDDWFVDFGIDELHIDCVSGDMPLKFIYKVVNDYIQVDYEQYIWLHTAKYVKPVEVITIKYETIV